EDWLRKFHHWDKRLGRRSLDYVTKSQDGKLQFHPNLIVARLKPYLDAGYKPVDITLALGNTPWDLATPVGSPPKEGVWGRKTPPGDLAEWGAVVRHFALDLKNYLGEDAEKVGFETGVEFDEKSSFDGGAQAFFRYYEATDRALHSVLPRARVSPGEFTGGGECRPVNPNCVYDTQRLIDVARRDGLVINVIPRSLHSLVDKKVAWPSEAARRTLASFARLPGVTPEIHQFGLLFEPFGEDAGSDPGPMYANWEFQTLARLLLAGPPRRVFHWGGFIPVGKFLFLNGSGFLRLVLDHYLGRSVALAETRDTQVGRPFPAETFALSLTGADSVALIASSFSPRPAPGARPISIELPAAWKGKGVKLVRYRASDNVFASIKRDLAAKNNLRSEFSSCLLCLGSPIKMAADVGRVRKMIARNWPRYEREMRDGLKWVDNDPNVFIQGRTLTAQMEANELLIVEPLI
ncbi:MAG TPA: hypothetical protein VN715_21885, partial [Roseiarcus sp.]|nr:hypothetical protein [Roseiarcus sp.]